MLDSGGEKVEFSLKKVCNSPEFTMECKLFNVSDLHDDEIDYCLSNEDADHELIKRRGIWPEND